MRQCALDGPSLLADLGRLVDRLDGCDRERIEGVGPAPLLTADEIDSTPVDQRQQPRRGLAAGGVERDGRAPGGEERLLDGVLGQHLVAQDPEGEAIGDSAEAVVQRGQGLVVGPRDERQQRLVR